jgi:hypothetical protein
MNEKDGSLLLLVCVTLCSRDRDFSLRLAVHVQPGSTSPLLNSTWTFEKLVANSTAGKPLSSVPSDFEPASTAFHSSDFQRSQMLNSESNVTGTAYDLPPNNDLNGWGTILVSEFKCPRMQRAVHFE